MSQTPSKNVGEGRRLSPTQTVTHPSRCFLVGLLLLVAFLIASIHLDKESIWYDEGWSMWATSDSAPVWELAPRDAVRGFINNLRDMLQRVHEDVHPPLYFLLLDLWTLAVGESVFTARLLSTFAAMIGLAATYAVGVRLFNRRAALVAVALLMTASFFVYYARELRMYTLLLALSVMSMWFFLRWLETPSVGRATAYTLTLAALLYTHYAGTTITFVQLICLAMHRWDTCLTASVFAGQSVSGDSVPSPPAERVREGLTLRRIIPYIAAVVLFLPWMPALIDQLNTNPDGPLAFVVPTDLTHALELLRILSGGAGWVYGIVWIVVILTGVVYRVPITGRRVGIHAVRLPTFLLLWLIAPPAILFILNAAVIKVYQVRCAIPVLPAWCLLAAWGLETIEHTIGADLRHALKITLFSRRDILLERLYRHPDQAILLPIVLVFIAYLQLANYVSIWGDKPHWRESVRSMIAARSLRDPAITDIDPKSVIGYYERQYRMRRGTVLDLSWRDHTLDDMRLFVSRMANAPSVWMVMPTNIAKTWYTAALLAEDRQPGYRDALLNIVWYRFDNAGGNGLQFRFGETLRYTGELGTQYTVHLGERLCPEAITFIALQNVNGRYSAGLHITQDHQRPAAQWDGGIGFHNAGDRFALPECVDIPPAAPAGIYHVRLVVYDWQTVTNLPVIEDSVAPPLLWGEAIFVAEVNIVP